MCNNCKHRNSLQKLLLKNKAPNTIIGRSFNKMRRNPQANLHDSNWYILLFQSVHVIIRMYD